MTIWIVVVTCTANNFIYPAQSKWACQTSARFFSGQPSCNAVCLKDEKEKTR